MKKLPKHLIDSLVYAKWIPSGGSASRPESDWVKDGVMLSIYPARAMGNMYHVGYQTTGVSGNRFIHIDKLQGIIRGEKPSE